MESLIAILLWYYANMDARRNDPVFIKDYIAVEALISGVNPQMMQRIAYHESRFNCNAVGDGGESHGCWQIHRPEKKKVRPLTVEQAKNPIIATQWSIQTIKEDGSCRQWSVCKKVMSELKALDNT